VRQAVRKAVAERFLLQDDADRMIAEVEQGDVLRQAGAASPAATARTAALCGASGH
jgi:hypothetical protein